MKGVRRLLGGATQRPPSPPALPQGFPLPPLPLSIPAIQPVAPLALSKSHSSSDASATLPAVAERLTERVSSTTIHMSPGNSSSSLAYSRERDALVAQARPQSQTSDKSSSPPKSYSMSSPSSSPSSTLRSLNGVTQSLVSSNRLVEIKAWKRASASVDTRDELLISLLASEAVIDSRECDILCSDDVEELKKELQGLLVRLDGLQQKLQLETKMRDAAASLAKINASRKGIAEQSSLKLEMANRKVEQVQADLLHASERTNELQRKLLEHRAAVLSFSLRSLETKYLGDPDEPNHVLALRSSPMSPTTSETSYSSTKTKFDGLHFFSGHENALQLQSARKPLTAAEHALLEERLKETTEKLQTVTEAHNDAKREISMLKLELESLETTHAFELQEAEERLDVIKEEAMKESDDRFSAVESQLEEAIRERDVLIEQGRSQQEEIDNLKNEVKTLLQNSSEVADVQDCVGELDTVTRSIKNLMHEHGLDYPEEASLLQHVSHLENYFSDISSSLDEYESQRDEWESQKHELEEKIRAAVEERESLASEIEEVRRDHEDAKRNIRLLEDRLSEQAAAPAVPVIHLPDNPSEQVALIIDALKPVWNALPSVESRASKFGRRAKPNGLSPGNPPVSLSELDVRLLKTLYDGKPTYQLVDTSSHFTIDGFISRVYALITDDRALIERLVRFAQAHDLLRKNAERAQRIAQESSIALETYQKQVKVLEDRNMALTAEVNNLQAEIWDLTETLDKIMAEKQDVETRATEQTETCQRLTEANNALVAKALALEAEVASAPEAVRMQLEKQLVECKAELANVLEDLAAMRNAEASQNVALMDELNNMQSQNETLRAQLRALTAGKK